MILMSNMPQSPCGDSAEKKDKVSRVVVLRAAKSLRRFCGENEDSAGK